MIIVFFPLLNLILLTGVKTNLVNATYKLLQLGEDFKSLKSNVERLESQFVQRVEAIIQENGKTEAELDNAIDNRISNCRVHENKVVPPRKPGVSDWKTHKLYSEDDVKNIMEKYKCTNLEECQQNIEKEWKNETETKDDLNYEEFVNLYQLCESTRSKKAYQEDFPEHYTRYKTETKPQVM